MKEFDVALKAVAEGLRSIAQGVEKIAEKLEDSVPKEKPKRKAKAKPVRKAKAKATSKPKKAVKANKSVTAADTVLAIVSRSKKGVDSATLVEKTGFDKKKIANLVFKLSKQGKIKSVSRGVYAKV